MAMGSGHGEGDVDARPTCESEAATRSGPDLHRASTYPTGVWVAVEAPTFRKMVNALKSFGLNTNGIYEEQIADGLGVLERAMR